MLVVTKCRREKQQQQPSTKSEEMRQDKSSLYVVDLWQKELTTMMQSCNQEGLDQMENKNFKLVVTKTKMTEK